MTRQLQLVLPSEAQMRTAIAARNQTYDGRFYYGVITTGVFCLPSCAARAARPENLRFYFEAQDAIDAGLRACKRCRPLDAKREVIQIIETARYIEANSSEQLTLTHLAQRVGMTPARFRKTFRKTFAVTPGEYQDAARLKGFKKSLQSGSGVTDAIFAAGFGSTSRVYGESARNIGMTPSAYRAGATGEQIHHVCRQTVIGSLMIAATDRGVCFAQFGEYETELLRLLKTEFPNATLLPSSAQSSSLLDDWVEALGVHLTEDAPRPDLPLDLRGTAFQIKVWRYLLGVPEGDVISYGELAAGIDRPKAVRAAASACAANRIAVLVPCHRVLRGDGNLGGYRWGLERKRLLIDAERSRKTRAG
jgi:AraC family transcriptional regulator, regulatory protein of adaptative response / methylated-DNA-[protein]-cysteine methyltransferase